jgi:hypothetical protein
MLFLRIPSKQLRAYGVCKKPRMAFFSLASSSVHKQYGELQDSGITMWRWIKSYPIALYLPYSSRYTEGG